jgi:hypothetical protein
MSLSPTLKTVSCENNPVDDDDDEQDAVETQGEEAADEELVNAFIPASPMWLLDMYRYLRCGEHPTSLLSAFAPDE